MFIRYAKAKDNVFRIPSFSMQSWISTILSENSILFLRVRLLSRNFQAIHSHSNPFEGFPDYPSVGQTHTEGDLWKEDTRIGARVGRRNSFRATVKINSSFVFSVRHWLCMIILSEYLIFHRPA